MSDATPINSPLILYISIKPFPLSRSGQTEWQPRQHRSAKSGAKDVQQIQPWRPVMRGNHQFSVAPGTRRLYNIAHPCCIKLLIYTQKLWKTWHIARSTAKSRRSTCAQPARISQCARYASSSMRRRQAMRLRTARRSVAHASARPICGWETG